MTDGTVPLANARHEAFCLEVIRLKGNATQAYLAAGYSARGAAQSAHALLRNPDVQARIDNLRVSKLKALHMGAEETLAEIAKIARASMGQMLHITPDGDPYIDLGKADADTLDAIAEASIEDFTDGREIDEAGEVIKREVRRVKVKMHPKLGALTTLARHHGLLKDKVELSVDENFAAVMEQAQRRAIEARRKLEANDEA